MWAAVFAPINWCRVPAFHASVFRFNDVRPQYLIRCTISWAAVFGPVFQHLVQEYLFGHYLSAAFRCDSFLEVELCGLFMQAVEQMNPINL